MGIAAFSRSPFFSALLSPLQAITAMWRNPQPAVARPAFAPFPAAARPPGAEGSSVIKNIAVGARHTSPAGQKTCQTVAKAASPRRLKVVREFEAGISPACAGRMVISGRMADVCAELDRMALRESAASAH